MDGFGWFSDLPVDLIDVLDVVDEYSTSDSESRYDSISSEEEETEEEESSEESLSSDSNDSDSSSVIEMADTQPVIINRRRRQQANPISDEDEDGTGSSSPVIEIIDDGDDSDATTIQNDEDSRDNNGNDVIVDTNVTVAATVTVGSEIKSTPQKRKTSTDGNQGMQKKSRLSQEEDDMDGCPICFESWTNSGKHRLSSLKCGHLFGHSCVLRWLKQGERKCPQCNSKAKLSDIRILYAKRLTAIDNSELERANVNLEEEKRKRRECEMQLAQYRMKYQMTQTECDQLKITLEDLKQKNARLSLPSSHHPEILGQNVTPGKGFYKFYKCFNASTSGNCRVMDYSEYSNTIALSQPSPHHNFMAGFGIKKLSVADLRSNTFIFLHSKQIKDIKFFSGQSNWVMSASQDCSIKITNLDSQSVMQTFNLKKIVWSCCWDRENTNYLYAGMSTGAMALYDIRKTTEAVGMFQHERYKCPIVSMDHIPPSLQQGATSPMKGGLLVSTLKGVAFWRQQVSEDNNFDLTPNLLPVANGCCAGMCYSSNLNQILVTYRPGKSPGSKSTHNLYNVNFFPQQMSNGITCNMLRSFSGGPSHSILNRNALYNIGDENFVAFGNEANKTICIYDTKANKQRGVYKCDHPSMDIKSIKVNNNYLLATLTDKNLRVYDYRYE